MNFTINTKAGYAYNHVHLPPTQASTFHARVDLAVHNSHTNHSHATTSTEIVDDWTDEEEQEWDTLFAQPHVQAGLNILAEEAEQQLASGEIEEGGFAVE